MSNKSIQSALLWTHRWFGIIAGLYFAIMGLTGGYLLFGNTFERLIDSDLRLAKAEAPSYDLARIVTVAMEGMASKDYPNRITIPEDPIENVILNFEKAEPGGKPSSMQAFVDPSTLLFVGSLDPKSTLKSWSLSLHRDLLLEGEVGRVITAILGFLLLILLFSGLYLWWPKSRFLGRALKWPRFRTLYQSLYDLHKFWGIYSFALLLMMVVTGTYMARPDWFDWSAKEPREPRGERGPKGPQNLSSDIAVDFAKLQSDLEAAGVPARRLMIALKPAKMQIEVRSLPKSPKERSFLFDINSSELKEDVKEAAKDEGFDLKRTMHDLHEGKFWSGTGKWVVIWMTPLTLFFFGSGVWIWWRRPSRLRKQSNG